MQTYLPRFKFLLDDLTRADEDQLLARKISHVEGYGESQEGTVVGLHASSAEYQAECPVIVGHRLGGIDVVHLPYG